MALTDVHTRRRRLRTGEELEPHDPRLSDAEWRRFSLLCADLLGPADALPQRRKSYCVFTCFNRLIMDVHYWACGLPRKEDVCDGWIGDGAVWGQPFRFNDLARIVIPRTFGTEYSGRMAARSNIKSNIRT